MKKNLIILTAVIAIGVFSYNIFQKENSRMSGSFPDKNISDLEKKIRSRDLLGQFQKFNETFKIYQSWTPEQKKVYQEQHNLSPEFISATEAYFKAIADLPPKP